MECYHVIGHICVLFRLRLLPRKDLVSIRLYFLVDTATVYAVSFFYTKQLQWLAALQIAQHLYFFATWDESKYTKKVISWSSLDWLEDKATKNRWEPEMILGTVFDTTVHSINGYLLMQYIHPTTALTSALVCLTVSLLVLGNPRFAWTSPWSVKQWVKRRVKAIKPQELDATILAMK